MKNITFKYPKHIYQPIRQEIAVSYLQHELRKMFPHLRDTGAWKTIDNDVAGWFKAQEDSFFYPVRDFWNTLHGIMMGYKLKIGLLGYLTAENIYWQKEEIDIELLTAGVKQPSESLDRVKKYFEKTTERRNDPIIVTQKEIDGNDKLSVYDGNGRLNLAILEREKKILAFVGRFRDEKRKPYDTWVPTSLLMEIAYSAREAWREKDESVYTAHVQVLKRVIGNSQSGKYEMKDRAYPHDDEFRKKLLLDLKLY